ncbi:MAG: hypothetical protein NTW86_06360 [Candidatus Sumerlaeota bacterium]|nr:hypothetical protein [Candidatus Sumerlaeota bacterium]
MTELRGHPTGRPTSFEDRFRLYLDESGDHVFQHLDLVGHRYLCLLGCWFRNSEYLAFHEALVTFKKAHVPHHPDDPPVLHREDIMNRRGSFKHLQDPETASTFDNALLTLIAGAQFRVVAVVIDKLALREEYGDSAAHPYHLALGFMLQRYCGYLNHISRCGDVMAESRGGTEDRLLADSYERVYSRGVWMTPASAFQQALTSRELKIKKKAANIARLQLSDLLGHPVRHAILREEGRLDEPPAPFAARLMAIVET